MSVTSSLRDLSSIQGIALGPVAFIQYLKDTFSVDRDRPNALAVHRIHLWDGCCVFNSKNG